MKHRMSHGIIVSYEETNEAEVVEQMKYTKKEGKMKFPEIIDCLFQFIDEGACRVHKIREPTEDCLCLYCRSCRALSEVVKASEAKWAKINACWQSMNC